ncbi:adenylosuccinate lyase, partial [Patescibacteria group bacterium]|nr:adenylosuccinate lyase [Patescibacteria group bacterium]
MSLDPLVAISPIDGRYRAKTKELANYFSEQALIKYRIYVEVEWFIFLLNDLKLTGTKPIGKTDLIKLREIYKYFDTVAANRVKDIEKVTNHDVKAVEYYIKENIKDLAVDKYSEFIHFGCTSEDISNLSVAMMLRDAVKEVVLPLTSGLIQSLYDRAKEYKNVALLALTHGQPASPTTVGKEFINVVERLSRQYKQLQGQTYLGKINGAVGNFNAHLSAYSGVDWLKASEKFVTKLGLTHSKYTTQIEPHDFMAENFHNMIRMNNIVLDFDRDIWTYISRGIFKQKLKKGEIGSSTMPHKVNPIDFEN